MATVGPSSSTASASSAATTRLKVDSHLIPRSTPVTAEVRNSAVVIAMIPSCEAVPTGSPNTRASPLLICSAPMPSDAATPKAVAITANTLNSSDIRCTGRHGSAWVAVLTSAGPPRRNWK